MSEKKFDIFFEFNYLELNIAVFNKSNNKTEYSKTQSYKSYFKKNAELNFSELNKLIEENIFQIEKSIQEFVKDVYLIIDTPGSITFNLSVMKNNEGNKITKNDIKYLIQDAKQQLLKSNLNIDIIHIIVENYFIDEVQYKFLPLENKCKKFSIELNFICFPKSLIENFKDIFLEQQILINKFICSDYVKKFNINKNNKNICEMAKEISDGINKQEVVSIPKMPKKKGFFEKLFHFFR